MTEDRLTPREAFAGFSAFKDDGVTLLERWQGRTGRVPIEQLANLVDHHTMRTVSVSTENFGLVECPKAQVLRRLRDDWFLRRVKRVEDEKGVKVEASVSIHRLDRVKHEAYRMSIQTIGGWTGEGTIWMVG